MEFTLWDVLTDLGLLSLLLLLGVVLRARITLLQRSFMPASIIAGILGLILGPNGFGVIPFSDFIGTYPSILIAVVFASIPLSSEKFKWRNVMDKVGGFWVLFPNHYAIDVGSRLAVCFDFPRADI